MAKFKPVRPKSKSDATPQMKAGLPCIVFLVLGLILVVILLYLVVRYAS